MINIVISVLTATIRAGTPILLATQGEIVTERSGIINIGLEGLMLIGALFGFMFAKITGSPWMGVLFACLAGAVFSLLHALLTISFAANQVVSGMILNFIGTGLSSVIGAGFVGKTAVGFEKLNLGFLSDIPFIGPILFNYDVLIYISIILSVLITIMIFKTRPGLSIRAVGDSPIAADTRGVSVLKVRYGCVLFGGALCGLAGAYISLAYTTLWQPAMTGGKGWIAISLVIFSRWNPLKAMLGAYLFGGIAALQLTLQTLGTNFSSHFLDMMPYLFTILVLVFSMWKAKRKGESDELDIGLASLGKPYFRER